MSPSGIARLRGTNVALLAESMQMDLESIDLAKLGAHLRTVCGPLVEGAVVGRTRLRDEVVRHSGCSLLEAEQLVDTMILRGFIVEESRADGWSGWSIRA